MDMITYFIQQSFSYIGPFFILLGLLIFVHEWGHFIVAKWCGVRVEVFSLGFGKKIFQFQWGDTIYCISLIPLGGYVKMFGDDPRAEISKEEKSVSFSHKGVWQRIAIVLAGPLMNFILAVVLFAGMAMIGEKVPSPVLGDISVDSKAYNVGFRSGDRIDRINNTPIYTWKEVDDIIKGHPGDSLVFKVQNSQVGDRSFKATPLLVDNDQVLSWREKVGGFDGLSPLAIPPLVGVPDSDSVAAQAGLKSLDTITKINGREIRYWRNLGRELFAAKNKDLVLTVNTEEETREVVVRDWKPSSVDLATFELGVEKAELYFSKVVKGSPAEKAGLKRGDKVVSIHNQPIHGVGRCSREG